MPIPALFTRMSMPPNSSAVACTALTTLASSATSMSSPTALTPMPLSSSTAALVFSRLRAATDMFAPAPASDLAMPSPMPPLPPVTSAVFPFRSN